MTLKLLVTNYRRNHALIIHKTEKIKKKLMNFFKSSGQFLVKFKNNEHISKQLTALIAL